MLRKILQNTLIVALCLGLAFPPASGAQDQDRRTGEWQQFIWTRDGNWRAVGTFLVYLQDGVYHMRPIEQEKAPDLVNSRGLSDLHYNETRWTFNSDWGDGNIGVFRLTRIEPGVYAGYAYLREERRGKNLWVLVK